MTTEPNGGQLPESFGRYRILRRLGSGGMGVVYLGEDPRTSLKVAIKLLRPDFTSDAGFRERFRREIGAAFRVTGQYTARVLAADLDADPPYFVTEYVGGQTLAARIRNRGPMVGSSLRSFAADIAAGLMAIHAVGLVHRDLKPTNVLLSEDDLKLIDFGIAADPTASSLTRTGETVGTPGWLAPEQARGQPVGPPADVFAWGALVAFAATGREPFGIGSAESVLYRVVHEDPDLDGLDNSLRPLVAQAMAKAPVERPIAEQLHSQVLQPATNGIAQTVAAQDDSATPPTTVSESPRQTSSAWERNRGWAWALGVGTVIAVAVVVVVAGLSHSRSPNSTAARSSSPTTTVKSPATTVPSTSLTSTSTAPASSELMTVTAPNNAYNVQLPSNWEFRDAGAQGDHRNEVWYDPANPLRTLKVVLSGCYGCVHNIDTSAPMPDAVVEPGAQVVPISATKVGFKEFMPDTTYPDNGVVIILTNDGYLRADLFLPDSEHTLASRILNSLKPSDASTGQ